MYNKLIIIGNGFDRAHNLKTNYKDFIEWYLLNAINIFWEKKNYTDRLFSIIAKYSNIDLSWNKPSSLQEALNFLVSTADRTVNIQSHFLKTLLENYNYSYWVDIEILYFSFLKSASVNNNNKTSIAYIEKLNDDLTYVSDKLVEYLKLVSNNILNGPKLSVDISKGNFNEIFNPKNKALKVINFNYTDTVNLLKYASSKDIIHIHGQISNISENPIVFGYGDETDKSYQIIEDTGENRFLKHIKSFAYFKTDNYINLMNYIDQNEYKVYILGHSCGLSDRVLLSEIFEHRNCKEIEIYFHKTNTGNNFEDITQNVSRHFKPQNKFLMRRKIKSYNANNYIPQRNN